MNKFPIWKNITLVVIFVIAIIYALPNVFGQNPAIQISSSTPGLALTNSDVDKVRSLLTTSTVPYNSIEIANKNILVRFSDADTQLHAKALLSALGNNYIIALNLESATPAWLLAIGANPMKLGLDLQGGVNFLLQVDVDSVVQTREKGYVRDIGEALRLAKARYTNISTLHDGGISVQFNSSTDMDQGSNILGQQFADFTWVTNSHGGVYQMTGTMSAAALQKIKQYTIEQAMMTLRRRVNELGVSEAVVQQEGQDRVSVDLPGVQDAAQAKDILGKTATLEFHMVDMDHDAANAVGGIVPAGDTLYMSEGRPVLLKNRIVLSGDSITNAASTYDSSTGQPIVSIRLGGGGESLFEEITSENIGKSMATVYTETKSTQTTIKGENKITYKKESRVINIATIQSALGTNFQISGLSSPAEAKNLALLLKAGSLPANMAIIQERTVGPSMGKRNIHLGMLSIEVGFIFIVIFMIFYYELFGLSADIGLFVNLVFLIALLSLLGGTLTFPGIAGIVLTVGMAVDYNVLIYERIREELRNGMSPHAAIQAGYDRAFTTILDANLVSLIVALILFALGSGPVKGFAITLTVGLFTSIISSVTYTRMFINWMYGGRHVKRLRIGKVREK